MATAIYAFGQFSDGTFGSFANAAVTAETATEIQTGGVGINQASGISIGQAFANKTLISLSCLVQTDDAITGSFCYGYLQGPTGEMLCPVQGGNFGGVGLPRLKRQVRCVPGVKLFAAFDTVADAGTQLGSMAVYCQSGKSAIFSAKGVDAVKTSMTDVLTGATAGQSLANERVVCSYQTYPSTKGVNDNQAGNSGFYIESSDGALKLMIPPTTSGGASSSAGDAYPQGVSSWVEYAVPIPIMQNDTLSIMSGV
jgi:hypothetical protein